MLMAFSSGPGDSIAKLIKSAKPRICFSVNDRMCFPKKGVNSNISEWNVVSLSASISGSNVGNKAINQRDASLIRRCRGCPHGFKPSAFVIERTRPKAAARDRQPVPELRPVAFSSMRTCAVPYYHSQGWQPVIIAQFAAEERRALDFDSLSQGTRCLDGLYRGELECRPREVCIGEVGTLDVAFAEARPPQTCTGEIRISEPRVLPEVCTVQHDSRKIGGAQLRLRKQSFPCGIAGLEFGPARWRPIVVRSLKHGKRSLQDGRFGLRPAYRKAVARERPQLAGP